MDAIGGAHVELTDRIIGAAIEVHRTLGPGLLESAYEQCLAIELNFRGVGFVRQACLPIHYRERQIESAYRMDFLVEDTVILEIKAVESITPIFEAQILTYLRLAKKPVGLIINFHARALRDGLRRFSV